VQTELSVKSQMNMHDRRRFSFLVRDFRFGAPEVDQMFAVSLGGDEMPARDLFRLISKPALGRGNDQLLPGKQFAVIASDSVYGMTFRH